MRRIALVAHDNRKKDLVEWVEWNYNILIGHELVCTGTTGGVDRRCVKTKKIALSDGRTPIVYKLKSGPLGGDQQLGAMICEGKVFLWDPMEPQPHDVDVKALLRIAVLYNIPIANNRATADFIISSNLFHEEYQAIVKDYSGYIKRTILLQ